MNATVTETLDPELLRDAESTAQLPSVPDVEAPDGLPALRTLRLAPLAPPPAPVMTMPLPALVPAALPAPAPAPATPTARPSWLGTLLASSLAEATSADPAQVARVRRGAALACTVAALAFAIVALVSGLRGAPDEAAPVVAAALVVAHAIVALGAGAFSFALLRTAERLLGE